MSRITQTFAQLRNQGRAALMPYITAGFPSLSGTEALLFALQRAGADLIELGIPYSDPLADGTTVQAAGQHALQQGVRISEIHAMVKRVREQGLTVPVLYMVYYNCVYRHGEERFVAAARDAGVDGLIVPDLPFEAAESLTGETERRGLDLVYLLAPTSTQDRIEAVARRSRGFIYCVSVTGVTGAREQLSDAIQPLLERIRAVTEIPLAVGFGISTPEHAARVADIADGVIVGSALVERIREAESEHEAVERAEQYVRSLRDAMDQSQLQRLSVR